MWHRRPDDAAVWVQPELGLALALSGDGGDELFAGYNRYFWGPRIWNRLPPPVAGLVDDGQVASSTPPRE